MIKKILIFITILVLATPSLGLLAVDDVKTVDAEKETSDFVRGCTEENDTEYCLLEPIGTEGGENFTKFTGEQGLADYLNIGIRIFLGVVATLSVIMIVLGGIQYMTTDAYSKKEGGKEMITHSIGGLLLALASVLLLQTINPQLLQVEIDLPTADVTALSVDQPGDLERVTVTVNGQSVNYDTRCNAQAVEYASKEGLKLESGAPWGTNEKVKTGDQTVRSALSAKGIEVNKANCSSVGGSCTSVYGLPQSAVDGLIKLKDACVAWNKDCKVIVTGGTECWWHKTHGPGQVPVDIRSEGSDGAIFKKYIQDSKQFTTLQPTNLGPKYQKGSLIIVYEEKADDPHFHVNSW